MYDELDCFAVSKPALILDSQVCIFECCILYVLCTYCIFCNCDWSDSDQCQIHDAICTVMTICACMSLYTWYSTVVCNNCFKTIKQSRRT